MLSWDILLGDASYELECKLFQMLSLNDFKNYIIRNIADEWHKLGQFIQN